MKKRSRFFQPKLHKARQLAIKLDLMHIQHERDRVSVLRSERREKSNQHNYSKQLQLPRFSPTKRTYDNFSSSPPLSTGDTFLHQHQKHKLVTTSRAFSSLPNMKLHKPITKPTSQTDNPVIRNLKFLEFDRIVTEGMAEERMTKVKEVERMDVKNYLVSTQFDKSSKRSKLSLLDEMDFRDLKQSLRFDKVLSPGLMSQRLKHSANAKNTLRQTKDSSSSREFLSLDQSSIRQSTIMRKKLNPLKTNIFHLNLKDPRRTPTLKQDKSINSFMLK